MRELTWPRMYVISVDSPDYRFEREDIATAAAKDERDDAQRPEHHCEICTSVGGVFMLS